MQTLKKTIRLAIITIVVVAMVLVPHLAVKSTAQTSVDQLTRTPSGFTYDKVVELVLDHQGCDLRKKYYYSLVLRFQPTWEPESQMTICRNAKNKFEVKYCAVNKSIWDQLLEIYAATGREDPQEMAAQIKADCRTLNPDQGAVRQLMAQYATLRFSPMLSTATTVDGGAYELWFVAPSNKIHLSLSGSVKGDSQRDSPVIRWMAQARSVLVTGERRSTPR